MKQRLLGGKLPVSAVAMGCMRLADAKESPDRVIGAALELGIELASENRIEAAAIFELEYNAGGGHCFIPREKLAAVTAQMIDVDVDRVDAVLEDMIGNGRIAYEQIAGCDACYLQRLYDAECFTAERIAAMNTWSTLASKSCLHTLK